MPYQEYLQRAPFAYILGLAVFLKVVFHILIVSPIVPFVVAMGAESLRGPFFEELFKFLYVLVLPRKKDKAAAIAATLAVAIVEAAANMYVWRHEALSVLQDNTALSRYSVLLLGLVTYIILLIPGHAIGGYFAYLSSRKSGTLFGWQRYSFVTLCFLLACVWHYVLNIVLRSGGA